MPPGPRFNEHEARKAISKSRSWAEALRRLGYRPGGGNPKTLQKYAARWSIPTDHFDPYASSRKALKRPRIPLDEILVEHSTYHRGHLKRRLFAEGVKSRRCEMCGQGEVWQGRPMALILDHINGVGDDHRLENLRILCPNCAATLDTHCGRKNDLGPIARDCLRCGQTFLRQYRDQRYCSRECGSRWDRTGLPLPKLRKVERPPYKQLLAEVAEFGYLATGRNYGVSDNAIRKWIVWYERAIARRARANGDRLSQR